MIINNMKYRKIDNNYYINQYGDVYSKFINKLGI